MAWGPKCPLGQGLRTSVGQCSPRWGLASRSHGQDKAEWERRGAFCQSPIRVVGPKPLT